jgi:hypothetical protein
VNRGLTASTDIDRHLEEIIDAMREQKRIIIELEKQLVASEERCRELARRLDLAERS